MNKTPVLPATLIADKKIAKSDFSANENVRNKSADLSEISMRPIPAMSSASKTLFAGIESSEQFTEAAIYARYGISENK